MGMIRRIGALVTGSARTNGGSTNDYRFKESIVRTPSRPFKYEWNIVTQLAPTDGSAYWKQPYSLQSRGSADTKIGCRYELWLKRRKYRAIIAGEGDDGQTVLSVRTRR